MKKKHRFSVSLYALTVTSIVLATLAAVSVCITIFVTVYSRALMRDAKLSAEQAVRQTELAVNANLDTMKEDLSSVLRLVKESADTEEFYQKVSSVVKLEDDIFAVTVYDADGGIVVCAGSGYARKENVYRDLSFDKDLFDGDYRYALSGPHVQTLFEYMYPWVVTMATKTDEGVLGEGAYVAIDFKFSQIAKYIDAVGVGRQGYCYIIDRSGNIVYHPQQQLLYSGLKSEDREKVSGLSDGVHVEKDHIRALVTTADGRWRIVGVSSTEELAVERRTQIIASIGLSLFCTALIACVVLLVYSRIVTAPVRSLMRAMKEFEKNADGFTYRGGGETVAELASLSSSFEHMSVKIRELMEHMRKEEKALRKTELKALQAQINPHFLYNTLDSILWMCEQDKTKEAAEMISSLAKLFRISISRGHELIPIRDELVHAESYLVIQSYRYRNQFSYSFDTDPSLTGYLCNKITIQPLIENAIYHGIDRMVDEGRIDISVHEAPDDKNDIIITVADNGVGMTPEQCRRILLKERSDSSGIGVKNVNDRLKIYFGEKYGIHIESELDVGTTVSVRIPKVEKETDYEA